MERGVNTRTLVNRDAQQSTMVACAIVVLLAFTSHVSAEDTVTLSTSASPRARIKVTGRVVDYTGKEIVIELPGGGTKKDAGERVIDIQSNWSSDHLAADALFAQRQYNAALLKYDAALRKEERKWGRRKVLAQMVVCAREARQWNSAGDYFLLLVRDDPATPYFPNIPLAWLPGELASEQKALDWINRSDSPVAVLLGASHLLKTAQEAKALERLERLTSDIDKQVAALAEAQLWRGKFTTASTEQMARWSERIERFPERLLAGPYLVLGRALDYRQQHQQAALALMHVPTLYPQERTLAAEALVSTGKALEKLGQAEDAARLYREVVTGYSETRCASEAKAKLEESIQNTN
jgi:tetratricopeptide (TPR) repeat protein